MALITAIIVFLVLFNIPFTFAGIISNALGVSLAFLVVILSMKVSVSSQPLQWLGKNLFPLYIYQRIPMILFSTICGGRIIVEYPSLYIFLCVAVTLICAYIYRFIEIRIK